MRERWKALLLDFGLRAAKDSDETELDLHVPIPFESIPSEQLEGAILRPDGSRRSVIAYRDIVNRGINCIVQKGLRKGSAGQQQIAIKRPHYPHTHLILEALVQALAHTVVEEEGLSGAIPKVYDIYTYAKEGRFTMEWIEGRSVYDHLHGLLLRPAEFERHFLHILLQIAAILEILTRRLHLNHRDLKLDNLWIRVRPTVYKFGGILYKAPFQVVLLDFGFACIGNRSAQMILNLGNVIPDFDPCPKEGRDLYHCLNRLLELPEFAAALSPALREALAERMNPHGPSYQRRTHVITALPDFSMPQLNPSVFFGWLLARIQGKN